MTDPEGTVPAPALREPQEERGAPGSRDTGSDEPGGGPASRPADSASEDTDTAVDAQGAQHGDAPDLPTGDQAG